MHGVTIRLDYSAQVAACLSWKPDAEVGVKDS